MRLACLCMVYWVAVSVVALAQDGPAQEASAAKEAAAAKEASGAKAAEPANEALPASEPAQPGIRRALIVCGLAGDAMHRKQFADSIELLHAGLTRHHGFAPEEVVLLWGDEPAETDGPALKSSRGVLTHESLSESAQHLADELKPEDTLWVFVFGHAHYDGKHSWLNISGNDIHQQDFAKLFAGVACREQVFFLTTPASGFYLKPLAAPGRIVITATEPDLEVNETIFPHKLCRVLGTAPPSYAELDIDKDWRLTLLDAFLWSARETASDYATAMLLATEHALIEDSGDGRGTEVQINYLPEELGGRYKAGQDWPVPPTGDGALAHRLPLAFPPSPPVPPLEAPAP
jgi:hypothetical protein